MKIHEKYGRKVEQDRLMLRLYREDGQFVRRWLVKDQQEAQQVISDWFDWSVEAVANLDEHGKRKPPQ